MGLGEGKQSKVIGETQEDGDRTVLHFLIGQASLRMGDWSKNLKDVEECSRHME